MRYANEFAPRDGKMKVFFKKVPKGKSDGFAVLRNGSLYVIDAGHGYDSGMREYLHGLRQEWLKDHPEAADRKLQFDLLISHPHGDHINALPGIVQDSTFDIRSVTAPARSYLSGAVEGGLPTLTECEDRLDELERDLSVYGHTARSIRRIPFGIREEISTEEGRIEIFPAPYDWSILRERDDEGFRHIYSKIPATYGDNAELAFTNGILNGNSLWIKFTCQGQSVLFSGDQRAEPQMVQRMVQYYGEESFRCDVLKYLHHGQKNCCPYLMEITAPKITVFTVATGYEDPDAVTLCKATSQLYCVGKGDLTLTLDGETVKAEGIAPEA